MQTPEERGMERKSRLFACACCRRLWPLLSDPRSRIAVEAAEELADGKVFPQVQWRAIRNDAFQAWTGLNFATQPIAHRAAQAAFDVTRDQASFAVRHALVSILDLFDSLYHENAAGAEEKRQQNRLLNDIFGNPFRPITVHTNWFMWNDGLLHRMARTIYEERTFDDLTALADALEEAGCTDRAILGHCRSQEPHVRGCWVVDMLLGKE